MTIAAIPTVYRGVNFRSRLEARWAALFDLGKRQWAYEALDLEGYIPDFVLYGRRRNALVEVRPSPLVDHSCLKLGRAARWCAENDWRLLVLTEHVRRPLCHGQWYGFDTNQFYDSEPLGISGRYFKEHDWLLPVAEAGSILIHGRADASSQHWTRACLSARSDGDILYLEFGCEDRCDESLDGEWADFNKGEHWLACWAEAGNAVQWFPSVQ